MTPLPRCRTAISASGRVFSVVIRALSTVLLERAGVRHCGGARTGTVTNIQRFGSKLNVNVHLHVLALDGAP
jgi:hypothetical protein